jgi:predicted DNA-binding transcriptional regulator YafY
MATSIDSRTLVTILYTNHRGETTERRIIPRAIRFAPTEWHPEEQWILDALDIDRGAERSFAMRDIHAWRA